MKLRLQPGSVRFRLSADELNALSLHRSLTSEISLPPPASKLVFRVEAGTVDEPTLTQENAYTLLLGVPEAQLDSWAASRELEIRRVYEGPWGRLEVLLEKDLERSPRRQP